MGKKHRDHEQGPDERQDAGKLSRDLAIEEEMIPLDTLPPLKVRIAWWGENWEEEWLRKHRK